MIKKSLITMLNETDGDVGGLPKLSKAFDAAIPKEIKHSFKDAYDRDRPVPIINLYTKHYDSEIGDFGEAVKESSYVISPEKVIASGMGSKLDDPTSDELIQTYIEEALATIKIVAKNFGIKSLKPIGEGKNYISTTKVDTYHDFTPEDMKEYGAVDDESRYAIYRLEIVGLNKSELNFLKQKLKEEGLISDQPVMESSEKARLMNLAKINESENEKTKKPFETDVDEKVWEDGEPENKITQIKEFRNIVAKLIKEEFDKLIK